MPDTRKDPWWQSFYDDSPLELYMARTDLTELNESIAFLRDRLRLQPGAVIFDQCCGLGGLSIPLAEAGYRIIGADLCRKYINMARAAAKASGKIPDGTTDFFVGDAFEYIPATRCDAAFNWYTSFGYSPEDDQNRLMIDCAIKAIKPGAFFALDFLNTPMILGAFKEEMSMVLKSPQGDIIQTRKCRIESGLMQQHWTWTMPDGKKLERDSTLRAYMPADLVRLFKEVGFVDIELFGSCANGGEPLTDKSGRCIVVARKPA
ncbi:MAG: methyltransferase domain-containing protein [Cyanobacteria bacterium SZAS LIN-2]|nr:methyltransferase domain-containing protein [Cyanobacteria bacterium SZAS LIN-2]MBS2007364.1 methyltransferase domain-containing protein [Cyanobacteria bacterium SZAS TMP-1]